MIARCSTPAATASSMISAMNTEQCWPSETPCGAASASRPRWATSSNAGELAALLLDERPGPGAARLVHGAVDDAPLVQPDVLGVLPADLEDGVHPRIVVQRAFGVGRDLVENEDGLAAVARREQRPDDLPAAARHRHRADGNRPAGPPTNARSSACAAPTGSPPVGR